MFLISNTYNDRASNLHIKVHFHWQYKVFLKTQKFVPTPGENLTAYDTASIMHYDGTLRGYFQTPIITDKKTGKSIVVNRKMSPMDIKKLNQMYPCKQTNLICGKF